MAARGFIIIIGLTVALSTGLNPVLAHPAPPALPGHSVHRSVLFLAPHPDDDALYAGLLLRSLRQGGDVRVLYLSRGESPVFMAKSYLRSKGLALEPTDAACVARYEAIRGFEALAGLTSLSAASRNMPVAAELRLSNIRGSLKDAAASHRVIAALESAVQALGEGGAVYVPHPRDTNPGHRGTYEFLRKALASLGSRAPRGLKVFGYMVHYGKYAGRLGLGQESQPEPLSYVFDPRALEAVRLDRSEAVVKLDALLAHETQLSRDDVLHLGSPLLTGYLAGFVMTPEVVERLPSDPRLMPDSDGDLVMRGVEMANRWLAPRLGGFSPERAAAAIERLLEAAETELPAGSRASLALEEARFRNWRVLLRTRCARILMGMWWSR